MYLASYISHKNLMRDIRNKVHAGPGRIDQRGRKDQRSPNNGGPGRVYTEEQLKEKLRKKREKYLAEKPVQVCEF